MARKFDFAGVYFIRHLATGRVYVGSSKTVTYRLWRNENDLRAGKHPNRELQRVWTETPRPDRPSAFEFGVFERLSYQPSRKELNKLEQLYIERQDVVFNVHPAVSKKSNVR